MKTEYRQLNELLKWSKKNCTRNLHEGIEMAITNMLKEHENAPKPTNDLVTIQNILHQWILAVNDKVVMKPNKGEKEWFLELLKDTRLYAFIDFNEQLL